MVVMKDWVFGKKVDLFGQRFNPEQELSFPWVQQGLTLYGKEWPLITQTH